MEYPASDYCQRRKPMVSGMHKTRTMVLVLVLRAIHGFAQSTNHAVLAMDLSAAQQSIDRGDRPIARHRRIKYSLAIDEFVRSTDCMKQ